MRANLPGVVMILLGLLLIAFLGGSLIRMLVFLLEVLGTVLGLVLLVAGLWLVLRR